MTFFAFDTFLYHKLSRLCYQNAVFTEKFHLTEPPTAKSASVLYFLDMYICLFLCIGVYFRVIFRVATPVSLVLNHNNFLGF